MTVTDRAWQTAGAPTRVQHTLTTFTWGVFALDVAIITLVGVLAGVSRNLLPFVRSGSGVTERLGWVALVAVAVWVIVIVAVGGYQRHVFGAGVEEYKRILRASFVTAGLLGIGCYLTKFDFSRGFFLLTFAIGPCLLLMGRWSLRKVIHRLRRRGHLRMRVLISGSPHRIDEIGKVLRRENWLGYTVIGGVVPDDVDVDETPAGVPVLGTFASAVTVAQENQADTIFFAGGAAMSAEHVREVTWEVEQHGIDVVLAPSMSEVSEERVRLRPIGGIPLVHVEHPTWAQAGRFGKRLFDLVGSSLLLVALAPLLAVAALSVKLHDGGPVLFRQPRVGRDGVEFSCLKLRTMVVDAERRLEQLSARSEGNNGPLFKLARDPRITKPGRWLRRYSVDELPQLLNVFRGEMSLVGPRPPLPREVATYDHATARRLHVRPGMTGLWQVSGRSNLPWDETVRLDLYYVDNWSMLQDLNILARTARAVVSSNGAY